jgi:hypothetical protein
MMNEPAAGFGIALTEWQNDSKIRNLEEALCEE